MSNYKYYINSTQVYPLNDGMLNWNYDREDVSALVFSVSLESPITFNMTSSGFDFESQEFNSKCEELQLKVLRKCGSSYAIFWIGLFSIVEGEFDKVNGVYSIKPARKQRIFEDFEVNMFDDPESVSISEGAGILLRNYQARYFDKLLLFVAKRSNTSVQAIVSDFFQINPLVVSADCLPGVPNVFTRMRFCALSDVVEPLPSNPATREYVTFGQLMQDLHTIFDVLWYIDDSYNLRIEHSTYFDGTVGLDLTQSQYRLYTQNSNKYTYDLTEFPKKETWKFHGNEQVTSLTYTGLSNIAKIDNQKTYSTKLISTGFQERRYLAATDPKDGVLLVVVNSIEQIVSRNDSLQPEFLVQNIHTYNRPDLYSLYFSSYPKYRSFYPETEEGGLILQSVKPSLLQTEITVPLCCNDSFDPTLQVKTSMGKGYVHKGSFNQRDGTLSVQLKYKVTNCGIYLPSNIEGMQLWLQHNVGITHDPGAAGTIQDVSQWDDQSGHGRHATQATAADRPQFKVGSTAPIFFTASLGPAMGTFLSTPSFSLFPSKRGTVIVLIDRDSTNAYGIGGADSSGVGPVTTPGMNGMTVISTNTGAPSNTQFDVSLDGKSWYSENVTQTAYPQNQEKNGLFVIRRGADTSLYTKLNGGMSANNPMVIPNTAMTAASLIIGANLLIGNIAGNLLLKEVICFDRDLTDAEVEAIEFYFVKQGYYGIF